MFKTIFKYELKKLVWNRITPVAFGIMLAASIIMGLNEEGMGLSRNAAKKSPERDALNGRLLDDKLFSEMAEKSKDEYGLVWDTGDSAYEDAAALVINTVGGNIALKSLDAETYYGKRQQSMEEAMNLSLVSDSERKYWEKESADVSLPFTLWNVNAPTAMANGLSNFGTLLLFFIAICQSGIFAGEARNRTEEIIRSTKNGKGQIFAAKLLAGLIFTAASSCILMAAFSVTTLLVWGTEGFLAQVQLLGPFAAVNMTLGELIRILFFLMLAAAILYTLTAIVLSEVTKNELASMGILVGMNFAFFALSMFVPASPRVLSQALAMAPMTFISPRFLYEFRLVGLAGHFMPAWQFVPLLYLGISAVLLLVCARHYLGKKH